MELGGNGTSGSGTLLQTGTVTVDVQVSTTLTANQIGDVNDTFTIFVIVTNSSDATDTNFTAQTVTLYNPPQAPTNLTVEAGDTRLMLSWTSSPDSNVDHYNVYYGTISRFDSTFSSYYNGGGTKESPVNAGNVSSYVLSGLENGITYYVAVETVDTQAAKSAYSDEGSGTPVQTYGLGDISSEKGGCFIATAAFGGENDPQVQKLRSFRDRVLLPNRLGRFWVHRYYQASPPVARILTRSPMLKSVTRSLLGPVVWAARLITPPGDSGREKSTIE
ncbi:MAG: fibronectin type III domain-containing protein [Proteobacteria bacterium]|nr:fibronectin type III domain-containing protein [Pseudomonadota bacterium]